MKNRTVKVITGIMLTLSAILGVGAAAQAATVDYKGSAVSWDYGRSWGVYSYSNVQSGIYEHSSTANTTFSGWKPAGTEAKASQFVGIGIATAYWGCRG